MVKVTKKKDESRNWQAELDTLNHYYKVALENLIKENKKAISALAQKNADLKITVRTLARELAISESKRHDK